jgi:sulfur carrier protein ThiS adenylyltransferase
MKFTEIKRYLAGKKVGIAGAGGLGSNCAVALARSGVGTIVVSDFDIVSESNLNRQYYFIDQIGRIKTECLKENISRINPQVNVIAFRERLNEQNIPEIFAGCQVIVEAFDSPEMKQMLIETVQTRLQGIPLIVGTGMAGWGNCDLIKCRKIDDTLIACGDEKAEASDENPVMAPRVGVVANMQADAVIEILMKKL